MTEQIKHFFNFNFSLFLNIKMWQTIHFLNPKIFIFKRIPGNKMSKQQLQQQRQKMSEEEQAQLALQAQQNEALKELEMHKKRLQIYVFVCRCVAYPFIAKQPTDMVRRQLKITKQQLQQIKDNFEAFLNNKITNIEADEAFTNAVRSYHEVCTLKSSFKTKYMDRVEMIKIKLKLYCRFSTTISYTIFRTWFYF